MPSQTFPVSSAVTTESVPSKSSAPRVRPPVQGVTDGATVKFSATKLRRVPFAEPALSRALVPVPSSICQYPTRFVDDTAQTCPADARAIDAVTKAGHHARISLQ